MTLINFSSLNLGGLKPKLLEFPNKEFKIVIENLPKEKNYVIVVQTDKDPMKMIFATAMIVDIVKQNSPEKIILVHPWLSFSRQDQRFIRGEPLTLDLILNWYNSLGVTDIISFDIHAIQYREPGIHTWNGSLRIHNINFVPNLFKPNFPIMSPTDEEEPFLRALEEKGIKITYFKKEKFCSNCKKPLQECTCTETFSQRVVLTPKSPITSENALILDDIISGGSTMLEAVKTIKKLGVRDIHIAVTHGAFDGSDARELFSLATSIEISNTLQVKNDILEQQIVRIVPIEEKLLDYLKNKL